MFFSIFSGVGVCASSPATDIHANVELVPANISRRVMDSRIDQVPLNPLNLVNL